jgi:hypothetical protein
LPQESGRWSTPAENHQTGLSAHALCVPVFPLFYGFAGCHRVRGINVRERSQSEIGGPLRNFGGFQRHHRPWAKERPNKAMIVLMQLDRSVTGWSGASLS